MKHWWLAVGLLVASPGPVQSQTPARWPEGDWQGSLQDMLRLVLHIRRAPDGRLTATLDSPDQGAMGIPVEQVRVTDDSLHLTLDRVLSSYAGRFEASRDSITGEWRQGGLTLPLHLKVTEQAFEPRRPQIPRKPYPYAEDTVRVENRAARVSLAGTLTTPPGPGPFPCAVLITGSGPEDRDETVLGHRPFLVLADHLTRRGIAVLRLDDRGFGASSGVYATATSEDFASDIHAAVTFVKGRPRIDATRIGLIGHSEGGLIAPMVANRTKDVAFVVLLAASGLPGDSVLILQNAALRRLAGGSDALIEREAAAHRRIHGLVKSGADSTALMPAVRALIEVQTSGMPEEQRRAVGDVDSIAWEATRLFSSPWLRFFIAYDPRPALRRLTTPVLALFPGKDVQVTPKENIAALESALEAGGNRRSTVKELPGLNHLFQTATTGSPAEYGMIEETIAPTALEAMSAWITAQTKPAR